MCHTTLSELHFLLLLNHCNDMILLLLVWDYTWTDGCEPLEARYANDARRSRFKNNSFLLGKKFNYFLRAPVHQLSYKFKHWTSNELINKKETMFLICLVLRHGYPRKFYFDPSSKSTNYETNGRHLKCSEHLNHITFLSLEMI